MYVGRWKVRDCKSFRRRGLSSETGLAFHQHRVPLVQRISGPKILDALICVQFGYVLIRIDFVDGRGCHPCLRTGRLSNNGRDALL